MKKYFLLSIVLLSFLLAPLSQAIAEVPKTLNYQGRLLDAKLEGLDQTLPITFELYDSEFGGQKLWGETQNVSIEKGYFNVELGADTPINLPFNKQYWLQVTVANESPYPRTALTQVPYAFRTITADTAEWALQLIDGALTINMMSDEARTVAGGDVIGTYPELFLRDGAVVDNIGQGEITQMMLSPNVTTPPSGPARGDLTGNYPDPLIAEGAIKTNRIADGAVTYAKLQPANGPVGTILGWDGTNWIETDVPSWEIDAVIGNEILDATIYGGLERMGAGTDMDPFTLGIMAGGVTNDMLAGRITGDKFVDGTLGLNLMAPGQERGQVAWFDGTDWVLTPAVLPNNTQVLKWVQNGQNWEMQWADDKFTVPYQFTGASRDDANMGVTMLSLILDEADNSDQHVFYGEIADADAGSPFVGRNSGVRFDVGNWPVMDAEGESDQAFPEGVIRGVANVSTIHNGGSFAGYFSHEATASNTVGSISAGVFAMNTVDTSIANNDNIGLLANITAGGGDAWGTASIASGNAANNIGVVGFAANAGNNNWGVFGLSDENPTTFFEGADAAYTLPTEAAVIALSNNAGNDNVALYVENVAADSRAAYIRGGGVNNGPFFADPMDMDNATLVVYNPSAGTAPFATAIKTYGDIWANSAVGASQLVGLDKLTLTTGAGTYNTADAATFGELSYETGLANTADGSAIWINDDLQVQDNLVVAGPSTMNSNLTVNANTDLNGTLNVQDLATFEDDVHIMGDLDVDGLTTLSDLVVDNIQVNQNLNVDGATTLDETTVDGLFTVNGNSDLNGTLNVQDVATFQNDVQIDTDLNVDGMTTLDETTVDGTLLVTGMATFNDDVQIDMELNVDGVTTLDETIVDGTLNVTGIATFNDDVQVDMDFNVDGLTTLDGTTIDGDLDLNGLLNVENDATFQANVQIDGDLNVDGNTTLNTVDADQLTIIDWLDLGTNDATLHMVGAEWNYVGGTWTLGAVPTPGNSGDFLVSRGAGLSPVWTNSAANLGLGNLYVEDEIVIDAMPAAGVTDVVLNSNELTFDDANVTIGNSSGLRGNLTVDNDAFVGNDLAVGNDASVVNNLEVLGGDFTVYVGVADIQNSIVNGATGIVVVDDNFNVTGTSNFDMFADFDANVNIDGNLVVDGLSDLDNTQVIGTFAVTGNSTFTGTINQGGAGNQVTFNGNVDATNGIDVTGDANVSNNVNVGNNAQIDMNLNVDGATTLDETTVDGLFTVNGNSDLNGTLNVQNLATMEANAIVNGDFDVDGDAQFGTVAGDFVQLNPGVEFRTGGFAPTAGVNDNILASRGANLSPEWTSTLSNLSVDVLTVPTELNVGTLGVTDLLTVINVIGNTNATGNVTVSGLTQTNTLTVLDAAVIGDGDADDLQVAGDATIMRDLTVTRNTLVEGVTTLGTGNNGVDLIVDWNAQIDNDLNVDGKTTLDETDVEGVFNVLGAFASNLSGTLTVAGLTTINNSLTVANDVNIGDELNVTGLANFTSDVTVLSPSDLTIAGGDVTLSGGAATLLLEQVGSILDVRGQITNSSANPLYFSDPDGIRLADDADAVNGITTSLELPLTNDDTDLVTEGAVFAALGSLLNGDSGIDAVWNGGTNQWDIDWNGPLTKNAVISGAFDITFQNTGANGFTVNAPVDFQQTLDVDGAATLNSTLDVDLATTLNSTLDVDGATTLNANVTLGDANTDNIVFAGDVNSHIIPNTTAIYNLGSDAQRWGDLYLDGATLHIGDAVGTELLVGYNAGTATLNVNTINILELTNTTVTTKGNAVVESNTTLGDAAADLLTVNATSTFNEDVTLATANLVVGGTINATGDVDFDANLLVNGNSDFDGNVNVDGVITNTTGVLPVTVSDDFNVTGATDLDGTLNVDGASTFNDDVTLSGVGTDLAIGGNLTVTGTSTLSGNVDANNGLDVTGADLTVGGALFTVDDATGNTVIGGTLDVKGQIFNSTPATDVVINDNTTITGIVTQSGGIVTFGGNVNANAGLDVTGGDLTVDGGMLQAVDQKVVLGYSTAATLAALTASTGTVINYSAGVNVLAGDMPAGVNGQVIYIINTFSGIVNVNGVALALNEMVSFVYAAGSWHTMP